jgi:hypothetical protein
MDAEGTQTITQTSVNTVENDFNLGIQEEVIRNFVKRIVNCRSVAQLVSFVPAIAQERTKESLDIIVQAHVKKASAAFLLAEWRDALAKDSFASIPALKSIRAPSIQVSKLAEKDGSINKDFDDSIKEAKRTALTRMIEIKAKEVEALSQHCLVGANADKLHTAWRFISVLDGVSKEAFALLQHNACALSLVQSAISIGENTAQKQLDTTKKKTETVKKAQTQGTAVMPTDKKGLEEFIKEIHKRQKQSAMDKSAAKKSGKGRRGAGPSKTKNQKKSPGKGVKKNRKQRNGKRGTSSKKQPKKP